MVPHANMVWEPKRDTALRTIALLFALVALLAFGFQGSRGIWDPDEGFYAGAAHSMLLSGDYLVPRVSGDVFLDKPPLLYWAIVATMKVFGPNEWGARIFHALCFVATILLVAAFARGLWGRHEAMLAAAVYATTGVAAAAACVVTPDGPLTLFTTAAMYCFWRSVTSAGGRSTAWKMLLCACLGLGFLTKGPAVLIPTVAMFAWLILRRAAIPWFVTPWALAGLAIFAAVGLGWYVVVAKTIPGAAAYFWDNQVWGRLVSDKYQRNAAIYQAPLIYGGVLLGGTLPWSVLWLMAAWRGGARRVLTASWWRQLAGRPVALLLVLWVILPLAVLSLASSKLTLYVLPIVPALALATARHLARISSPRAASRFPLLAPVPMPALLALVLLFVAAKFAVAHVSNRKDSRALWDEIERHLPSPDARLVPVDQKIHGLTFYTNHTIINSTDDDTPYPFFTPPRPLVSIIDELDDPGDDPPHVFITRRSRRAKPIMDRLLRAGLDVREVEIAHDFRLLIADDPPPRPQGD